MRVGLVTDFYYPWIGGPSSVVRNLGNGLLGRGHEVHLLAPSPSGPAAIDRDGSVPVTRVATVPAPFGYHLRMSPLAGGAVARWLDATQPDVLHIHHPFPLSAAAVTAAGRRGIPILATNHTIPECSLWGIRQLGPLYQGSRRAFAWWLVHLLERCDRVATPTETAARALRAIGYARPIIPISNGVDTTRFAPGASPAGLRARLAPGRHPIVLYTGRLDAEKQMEVWLRAAAHVLARTQAQFLIGGQGTEREQLARLSARLGIDEHVRFIGYLPDDELPALYRLADVFFITSPVELQSICTLEAIASGLPVVAVEAGALPELVRHTYNGYLVAPGDWQAAGEALSRLLIDPTSRATMGGASRSIALEHDVGTTIYRYEQLLQATVAARRK